MASFRHPDPRFAQCDAFEAVVVGVCTERRTESPQLPEHSSGDNRSDGQPGGPGRAQPHGAGVDLAPPRLVMWQRHCDRSSVGDLKPLPAGWRQGGHHGRSREPRRTGEGRRGRKRQGLSRYLVGG